MTAHVERVRSQSDAVCQEKRVSYSVHREKREAAKVHNASPHDALGVLRQSTVQFSGKTQSGGTATWTQNLSRRKEVHQWKKKDYCFIKNS